MAIQGLFQGVKNVAVESLSVVCKAERDPFGSEPVDRAVAAMKKGAISCARGASKPPPQGVRQVPGIHRAQDPVLARLASRTRRARVVRLPHTSARNSQAVTRGRP